MNELPNGKQCFLRDFNRILQKELRLAENNRFKGFLSDLFYNTTSTGYDQKTAYDSDFEDADDVPIEVSPTVMSPLLDRFVNFAMTLHDPSVIKSNDYIRQQFIAELSLTFNVSDKSQA